MASLADLKTRRVQPLETASHISEAATREITEVLNVLLADAFALYLKSKNFHWHVSGPHFREYHLMFDEQAEQILAATDLLAERVRKVGGTTLRSIGEVARLARVVDNDAAYVDAAGMLGELRDDNRAFVSDLREAHCICNEHRDVASVSLLEALIEEAERRIWFLLESSRQVDSISYD